MTIEAGRCRHFSAVYRAVRIIATCYEHAISSCMGVLSIAPYTPSQLSAQCAYCKFIDLSLKVDSVAAYSSTEAMVSPARALKFLLALAVILNFSVVTCFLWTFVWLLCSPLGRRVLKREEDRLYAAYAWVITFFCNQWLDTEVRTCKRRPHLRDASALVWL